MTDGDGSDDGDDAGDPAIPPDDDEPESSERPEPDSPDEQASESPERDESTSSEAQSSGPDDQGDDGDQDEPATEEGDDAVSDGEEGESDDNDKSRDESDGNDDVDSKESDETADHSGVDEKDGEGDGNDSETVDNGDGSDGEDTETDSRDDEEGEDDDGGEEDTDSDASEGADLNTLAGFEPEPSMEIHDHVSSIDDLRAPEEADEHPPDSQAPADEPGGRAKGRGRTEARGYRGSPTARGGRATVDDDEETEEKTPAPTPEKAAGGLPESDRAASDSPGGRAVSEARGYRGSAAAGGASTTVEDEPQHAPDDEEMPLADHVEEMVRRLGVVLVLMAGVSAVVFPFGEHIINVIWYSFLPGAYDLCPTTSVVPKEPASVISAAMVDAGAGPGVTMAEGASIKPACPRVYQPLATIFARLKVSTLAGFVIALPAFVYETYLFMRPGLYPRERRYYLAAVPTSLVLAAVGVAFAYLLVLPTIFTYFLYYSEGAAEIAFGLTETFGLMVLMMGFFAAIFQIPLFIMLGIMMGVTSRQWLADRRLLFWAAFAGIAFIFNPDPTGMAPFIVTATMIVLFEGTLLLVSWTGSDGLFPAPEAVAARRPYAWVLAGLGGYLASESPLPESYYEQLPALLQGFIESNDLLGMTPIVVGGLLIGIYELGVYLTRRYLPSGVWQRRLFAGRVSLLRLRTPVWVLSLVVGYLTSPNPFLLDRARTVTLEPVQAGALAVGLIVGFEILLAVWKYARPDEDERLPLEE